MTHKELVAKAKGLELGSEEDLEKLTKADLVDLIGDEGKDDEEITEEIVVEIEPKDYVRKNPRMTTVEDCIGLGTMKPGRKGDSK